MFGFGRRKSKRFRSGRSRTRAKRQSKASNEQQRKRVARIPVRQLADLLALTPTQFELKVAELLEARGYVDVQHVGGAGDLAADIICFTRDGRRKVVVQCKQYNPSGKRVSSPEMKKSIGMIFEHHRAHQGIYVTTSSFTRDAEALARLRGIELVDGRILATWLAEFAPARRGFFGQMAAAFRTGWEEARQRQIQAKQEAQGMQDQSQ